ncbi:MAG: hypothetical protein ACJ71S_12420 [Acidobacteriaceae bacterium]
MSGGQAAEAASTAAGPEGRPPETRPAAAFDPALRRFLSWAVVLITGGYTFLDYWNFSRTFHDGGGVAWQNLLAGHGVAPAQYRIGVLRTADLLARLTHTHLRHMFAAIDCVSLGVSLTLLLWLLSRREVFRAASHTGRWLQASLALGCFLLYLLWSFWYQQPETEATLLLLVLSALAAQWRQRIPAVLALVALALIGATVRVDTVVAFHAGFLVVCLLPQASSLPLGRATQALASVLAIAAAVAVEYVIMHRIYPNAQREVAAVQLFANLRAWLNWFVLAMALFPWWMMLRLAARRWRTLDGWAAALVLGSVAHFVLFFILGIAWEVRIFLPFAMAVVPLTVTLAYAAIEQNTVPSNSH